MYVCMCMHLRVYVYGTDSSVSQVAGHGWDDLFDSRQAKEFFSSHRVHTGYGAYFLSLTKRSGHETDLPFTCYMFFFYFSPGVNKYTWLSNALHWVVACQAVRHVKELVGLPVFSIHILVCFEDLHKGQLFMNCYECPQCYCCEIRQMLIFLIDLNCPKAYHRPDHSIRIVEYHRKLLSVNRTSSPGIEPRTVLLVLWPLFL
jgi:hypothetical protein